MLERRKTHWMHEQSNMFTISSIIKRILTWYGTSCRLDWFIFGSRASRGAGLGLGVRGRGKRKSGWENWIPYFQMVLIKAQNWSSSGLVYDVFIYIDIISFFSVVGFFCVYVYFSILGSIVGCTLHWLEWPSLVVWSDFDLEHILQCPCTYFLIIALIEHRSVEGCRPRWILMCVRVRFSSATIECLYSGEPGGNIDTYGLYWCVIIFLDVEWFHIWSFEVTVCGQL